MDGIKFLINGEPFSFTGFGKHEDIPVIGKGHGDGCLLHDFELLKWIGADSFRSSVQGFPAATEGRIRICAAATACLSDFSLREQRSPGAIQQGSNGSASTTGSSCMHQRLVAQSGAVLEDSPVHPILSSIGSVTRFVTNASQLHGRSCLCGSSGPAVDDVGPVTCVPPACP